MKLGHDVVLYSAIVADTVWECRCEQRRENKTPFWTMDATHAADATVQWKVAWNESLYQVS